MFSIWTPATNSPRRCPARPIMDKYGMVDPFGTAGAKRGGIRGGQRRPGLQDRSGSLLPRSEGRGAASRVGRFHAWATGIRRDQSPTRANTPIVHWDKKFGLVKISPLAAGPKRTCGPGFEEGVPYNPLHDQGYPSIGCWPCTRAVTPGEDERAGRWSGIAKTECGLHTAAE